jgi:hypothetical protein
MTINSSDSKFDLIVIGGGPAVMEIKTVLPDLTTALTPSEDHLYWAYRSACA